MKSFGQELLLDCYECDPSKIDDLNVVYNFLEEAIKVLGVNKQSPPYVFHSPKEYPDKAGISSWVPLIESGIQCHTLTVKNFVTIDYYTCSDITDVVKDNLIELAMNTFGSKKVESRFILRGVNYYK
jgi:S-adenosylmethionine/arginine decarboxylase-like enzyme